MIIAPEDTRSNVQEWKGGFYHIAAGADLPVLAAQLDYAKKYVGIAQEYRLMGDYVCNIERIQASHRDVTATYPEQGSSCVKSL